MRPRFVCGAIPVWDGSSPNRPVDAYAAPNASDWSELIEQVQTTQTQVNTDGTDVTNLETAVGTYAGGSDISTELAAALVDIGTYAGGSDISTELAAALVDVTNLEAVTSGNDPNPVHDAGTPEVVAGMTVVERGDGAVHKTIITLLNVEVAIADGTVPATDAAWGTLLLYTLPEGHAVMFGGHQIYLTGNINATGTGALTATADLEVGVGTTARANASNFALQAAEDNLVPGQAGVDLVGFASDADESNQLAAVLYFDGSAGAATVNLNVVTLDDGDAAPGVDTLSVSGTITLIWTLQGDD